MMPVQIVLAESQATGGLCNVEQFVRRRLNGSGHRQTRHCRAADLLKFSEQTWKLFDGQLSGALQHGLKFGAHLSVSSAMRAFLQPQSAVVWPTL